MLSGLTTIIENLPQQITELALTDNLINSENFLALGKIPLIAMSSLDLSRNQLAHSRVVIKNTIRKGMLLCALFYILPSAVKSSVTSLNLSENCLGLLPADDLIEIFQQIPRPLKTLNLSKNDFDQDIKEKLSQVISFGLPRMMELLDLSGNRLHTIAKIYQNYIMSSSFSVVAVGCLNFDGTPLSREEWLETVYNYPDSSSGSESSYYKRDHSDVERKPVIAAEMEQDVPTLLESTEQSSSSNEDGRKVAETSPQTSTAEAESEDTVIDTSMKEESTSIATNTLSFFGGKTVFNTNRDFAHQSEDHHSIYPL